MEEKIYCIYCGTKNKVDKKRCKKCFKKLYPKEHLLVDYFLGKGEGKLEDGFWKNVKQFLIHHLYGTVMACSIFVTAITTFVAIKNNQTNFEIVNEKPKQIMTYIGDGLNDIQIVQKYIDAIKTKDEQTIEKLRLETYYPEIRKEIKENGYGLSDTYFDPILEYEYSKNGEYYYKEVQEESEISRSVPAYGYAENYDKNEYSGYMTYTYEITLQYCSYNNCQIVEQENMMASLPSVTIWIQVALINGNYYILGEQAVGKTIYDFLANKLLLSHHGNTKDFSFSEIDRVMPNCYDEEDCLQALGINF